MLTTFGLLISKKQQLGSGVFEGCGMDDVIVALRSSDFEVIYFEVILYLTFNKSYGHQIWKIFSIIDLNEVQIYSNFTEDVITLRSCDFEMAL